MQRAVRRLCFRSDSVLSYHSDSAGRPVRRIGSAPGVPPMTHLLPSSLLAACTLLFACSGAGGSAIDDEDPVTERPSNDGGSPGEDDGEDGFVVHYFSPWSQPYVHFDDGSGWTTEPGLVMEAEGRGWFVHEEGDAQG